MGRQGLHILRSCACTCTLIITLFLKHACLLGSRIRQKFLLARGNGLKMRIRLLLAYKKLFELCTSKILPFTSTVNESVPRSGTTTLMSHKEAKIIKYKHKVKLVLHRQNRNLYVCVVMCTQILGLYFHCTEDIEMLSL